MRIYNTHNRRMRQLYRYIILWCVMSDLLLSALIVKDAIAAPVVFLEIPAKRQEIKPISVVIDYTKDIGTIREVTAYTSRVEETDATPCIAADGSDICKRIEQGEVLCAANFVPLGTTLAIDKFGECKVADRMNKRYGNRVDIYMGYDLERALKFGKQKLEVAIKS